MAPPLRLEEATVERIREARITPQYTTSLHATEDYNQHWGYASFQDKVILDLGADWGSTVAFFLKRGAKRVIAVEGIKQRANDLFRNYANHPQVHCLHMMVKTPHHFQHLITKYKPDLVKCDIEGDEQQLLNVPRNYVTSVPEWLVETHGDAIYYPLFKRFTQLFHRATFHYVVRLPQFTVRVIWASSQRERTHRNPTIFKQYIVKAHPVNAPLQPLAIGTPFYYSFHFLEDYFDSLIHLDYPKNLLSLYFPVQGEDDTYQLLQDFKDTYHRHYAAIHIVQRPTTTHGVDQHQIGMTNIVAQRNWIREHAKPLDVLFIGHDNFVPPHTVKRLLDGKALGADIVGGVYAFYSRGLGFTSFFHLQDGSHDTALISENGALYFPECLMGKRAWTWTTGMDTTLVRREVLDTIDFTATSSEWSDDVEYCYKAQADGFKVMTDYGLFVTHWGFKLQFLQPAVDGKLQVLATMQDAFSQRRKLMIKLREFQARNP